MEINYEKNKVEENIPQHILNLYKIYGYDNVAYKRYIKSKNTFESKVSNSTTKQENQSLLTRIKAEILAQSKDRIAFYIKKALRDGNIEIQRIGASLIQNAPEDEIEELNRILIEQITNSLNSDNIQIQRIAINMIPFSPSNQRDQLRKIVLQKIIDAFNSNDASEWRVMAKKIKEAPEEAQDDLREMVYHKIIEALDSEDIRVQRLAAITLPYAPKDKQDELVKMIKIKFELAKQQGKFNKIIESPLYIKSNDDKNSIFSHEDFSKTGSRTTLLLGKQFRNNLIIRHIEEPCFSAWRKVFESHENWVELGFDYIPIEPIYSFEQDSKSGLIKVLSGVLDINLEEWYAFSGDAFKDELDKQKNKIINALSSMNINHGHANNANFCLRFYRNENGDVDIDQIPKIYLIDFDKAIKY